MTGMCPIDGSTGDVMLQELPTSPSEVLQVVQGNRQIFVVQLGGFVSGEKMKKRAMEVAKGVKGVTRVEDALYVKPE